MKPGTNKMNPLCTLKEYLKFLGILQPSTQHEQREFFVANVVCCLLSITYVTSIVWYMVFEANKFAEYIELSYYLLSASVALAWYSLMVWKRDQYSKTLALIDVTVQKRCEKSVSTETIYQKTDQTVETVTKNVQFFCLRMLTTGNVMVPFIVSLFKYSSSRNFDESFSLFIKASYPFDIHKPIGYTFGYIIQLCQVYNAVFMFALQLYVIGGFICFASAFTLDITEKLDRLDVEVKTMANKKLKIVHRDRIHETTSDVIRFHSESMSLCGVFDDLINGNIILYMVYSLTCFCGLLVQEKVFLETGNYSELLTMFAPSVAPIVWLYLFCYSGSFLSDQFSDVGNKFYDINWYMLPLYIQRTWPNIIAAGQQDIILHGFGSSSCDRELFKKIMNTTFSYFTVLRSFEY